MPLVAVRLGGYQGETSILTRALRRLAASLAAIPGAGWQVEVVRDVTKQGARAVDLLAMVEQGTVQICYFASGYLATSSLGASDAPFPALDRARLYAQLDGGGLGARLAGDLARRAGYRLLGWWDNGVRHITNRLRPIRRPDDCRGLRIRTLDNATYQRVFAGIGFTPVVIDVKDLARAVETHAVDAQENPLTNTVNCGLHKTH
jgi:TRAP-type C4-dicarboxylate transport system substrate-binding protein